MLQKVTERESLKRKERKYERWRKGRNGGDVGGKTKKKKRFEHKCALYDVAFGALGELL